MLVFARLILSLKNMYLNYKLFSLIQMFSLFVVFTLKEQEKCHNTLMQCVFSFSQLDATIYCFVPVSNRFLKNSINIFQAFSIHCKYKLLMRVKIYRTKSITGMLENTSYVLLIK